MELQGSSRKSALPLRFRWELMDSYGLRRQFEELLVAAPAPTFSAKKRTEKASKASSNGFLGGDQPRFVVFKWKYGEITYQR